MVGLWGPAKDKGASASWARRGGKERNRKMKIAISAMGETLDSPVDQRFGRARYFILYDTSSEEWSAHDNKQNLDAAQGAGIQAGQTVSRLGAEVAITGHCGPKAFATLEAAGIEMCTGASGIVKDALEAYKAGKLNKAEGADVGSHFGSI